MTLLGKFCFTLFLLQISFWNIVRAGSLPAVEHVLQQGFPARESDLEKMTLALFQEYQYGKNVVSLIFYSYGLLLQAQHFTVSRDYINAAEYSRTAFFYLDEAVDISRDKIRARYLRARVDAWLPAKFGRCVITLEDTANLLTDLQGVARTVLQRIKMMRYRALFNCQKFTQAEQILNQIKTQDRGITPSTAQASTAPPWDLQEINEIVVPLLKEE